jgi:hypothetical protein
LKTFGRVLFLPTRKPPEFNYSSIREALDDYTQALFGLLAFVNEARWDPEKQQLRSDVRFEIGRRMTTSPHNPSSPSADVTPDCVLMQAAEHGVVAEAKIGLPRDESYWSEDVCQIQKYDDDLIGWWTPNEHLESHDLAALIPLPRAVRFFEVVNELIAQGKAQFNRTLAVIGFHRQSGPEKTWMFLKKEGGKLTQQTLDNRLKYGQQIDCKILIDEYGDRKFWDHPPDLPITLWILWDNLFTQYAANAPMGKEPGVASLTVTATQVTQDLQTYYGFTSSGERSPGIPRTSWIREALDTLVGIGLADKASDGKYFISYKRYRRGDMLERFCRLCSRAEKKKRIAEERQEVLRFGAPPTSTGTD